MKVLNKINIVLSQKPLLQKVARGFLVLVILVFVWWMFGLEFASPLCHPERVERVEGSVCQIANVEQVDIIQKKDYTIVKIKNNQHLSFWEKTKEFFYKPFYNNNHSSITRVISSEAERSREILSLNSRDSSARYHSVGMTQDNIVENKILINNINLKDLLNIYEKTFNADFISILDIDNLTNNFDKEQKEAILSVLGGEAKLIINQENKNNPKFQGVIRLENMKDIQNRLTEFEEVIKYNLAVLSPESKRVILPDNTYALELIVNPENFSFEDRKINNKNLRYIKSDEFNFELTYYIEGNNLFFANSLDGTGQDLPNLTGEQNLPLAIIPTKFFDSTNFIKQILGDNTRKYNSIILTENKKLNETVLIFK